LFYLSTQEANGCDGEIQELRDHQVDISSQLEQRQINVQQLQGSSDTMDGDIERLLEVKQKVNYMFVPNKLLLIILWRQ